MLDIFESFIQGQRYSYVRMDGTTGIPLRQPLINRFNQVNRSKFTSFGTKVRSKFLRSIIIVISVIQLKNLQEIETIAYMGYFSFIT